MQTLMGNHFQVFGEHLNGSATDWVTSQTGIIAMSPMLGSIDILSMEFDLESAPQEAGIIIANMELPLHLLDKASPMVTITRHGAERNAANGLKLHVPGGKARFVVDIANSGMTDVTEPFQLTVSFTDGWTEHEQCFMAPALASRTSQTIRINFNNVSTDTLTQLWELQNTESVAGRVGLYLDIELGDSSNAASLAEELGWTESNERIFFPLVLDSFVPYDIPGIEDTLGRWTIQEGIAGQPPAGLSLLASSPEGDVTIDSVTNFDQFRSKPITALGVATIIIIIFVVVHLTSRLYHHCTRTYSQKISAKTADHYVGV